MFRSVAAFDSFESLLPQPDPAANPASGPPQLLAVGPFVAVLRRVAGRPTYSLYSFSCENCDTRLGRYTCEALVSPSGLPPGSSAAAAVPAGRKRFSAVDATAAVAAAAAGPVIDALRGVVGAAADTLPLPASAAEPSSRDSLRRSFSQGMRDALAGIGVGGGTSAAAAQSPAASSEWAPGAGAAAERPRQRLCDITQANVHVPQAAVDIRVLRVALPRVTPGEWSRAVWCPRNAKGSGTGVSARARPPSPHLGGSSVVGSRRPSFQLLPPGGGGGGTSSSLSNTAPASTGGGGASSALSQRSMGSAASNPGHMVASTVMLLPGASYGPSPGIPDGRAGGGKDGGQEFPFQLQPPPLHAPPLGAYTGTSSMSSDAGGGGGLARQASAPLGIGARDRGVATSSAAAATPTPTSSLGAGGGGGVPGLALPPRPPTPTGYATLLPPPQYPPLSLPSQPLPILRSVSAPEQHSQQSRGPPLTPGGGVAAGSFFRMPGDSAASADFSAHTSQASTPNAASVYPAGVGSHVSLPGAVTAVQAYPPGMQQPGQQRARLGSAPPFSGGGGATYAFPAAGIDDAGAAAAGGLRSGTAFGAVGGRDSAGSAGSGASSSLSVNAAAVGAAASLALAASGLQGAPAAEGKSGSPRSVAGASSATRRLSHSRGGSGGGRGSGSGSGGSGDPGCDPAGGGGGAPSPEDDCMSLESRQPEWSDELSSLTMKFLGQRIADSSSKNFLLELVEGGGGGGGGGGADAASRGGLLCTPCLQFGKIANGRFSCDWRFPLAPIQAFGIFLTAFQWLLRDADGTVE